MDKLSKPSLLFVALAGALATVPIYGWRLDQSWAQAPTPPSFALPDTVAEGTTVRIDGTPSMAVVNQTLAEGFRQRFGGTEVTLAEGGDREALRSLRSDSIDLAALGRSLTDDEIAQSLTEVPITREKIAIIVGRDNPFQGDLSFSDFARIFRGEITNWAEVGGPNAPIAFVDRPADSDVRRALSEYDVFRQATFATGANAVTVAEDNTAAVARELGQEGISYAIASEVLNQDAVRVVSMHSTLPSDPRYPYSQPRNYVYRGEASEPVTAFLGFATSPDGQAALALAQRTERANVTVGAVVPPGGVALATDGQWMVRGTETGRLEWLDADGNATDLAVDNAHRGSISAVAISPDGQTVISGGADGTLRRWDRQGNPLGEPMVGNDSPVLALSLSPDGQTLVSGHADGTVQRWSMADGTPLGEAMTASPSPIQALAYPPGGQNFITGNADGTLALWNADGTPAGQVESGHSGGITQIVSHPDGQVFATTGGDGTLRTWDRATLEPRGEAQPAHNGPVYAAAYNADGSALATAGADDTLQLWNPDGSAQLPEPLTIDNPASSLGFRPDGEIIAGTVDGRVEQRSPDGELVATTNAPTAAADAGTVDPTALLNDWQTTLSNLPRNTWWILAAIPLLLIVLGLLGSLLGRRRSPDADPDSLEPEPNTDVAWSPDPVPGSELDLDFSGLADPSAGTGSANFDVSSAEDASPTIVPQPAAMNGIDSTSVTGAGVDNAAFSDTSFDDAALHDAVDSSDPSWNWEETDPPSNWATGAAIAATAGAATLGLAGSDTPDSGPQYPDAALPPEASLVLPEANAADMATLGTANKLEQARADLAEGKRFLQEQQYEAALIAFNSAIEATEVERLKAQAADRPLGGINALATQAHTQRGHALARLQQGGDAMDSYNTALGLNNSTVEAWVGKGQLLLNLGRYDEALFCFDSALELDPSQGEGWAGKGQVLNHLGRYSEGQTCLARAAALGVFVDGFTAADPGNQSMVGLVPDTGDAAGLPSKVAPPTSNYATDTSDNYDPDIPFDLQQVVMGLPSADTELAYAEPMAQGVPPELAAEVAQWPSQPDHAPGYGMAEDPTMADYHAEAAATYDTSAQGGQMAYPRSPVDALEERLLHQIDLSAAVDWAAPTLPTPNEPTSWAAPEVPSEPGDFIPPPAEDNRYDPTAQDNFAESAFSDAITNELPPEVLAAMASIPPSAADSFGLVSQPQSTATTPEPGSLSWLRLSLDPDSGERFYALWHLDEGERATVKHQGGETLALRLYDVTGRSTQAALPPPVEEQRCHDDFAQDWYLPIPQWDRIYLAEIGYRTQGGQWFSLARSSEVPVIASA